jgi:hypothetical protein
MGTNVFINGDEASSRAAGGKSIATFPDPCWSPPSPPAGPVVIPYPNTAQAKHLTKGTTTVFIKGTPVAQEDKSYFSTSVGNEPATKTFPQGVATQTIKGKAYFCKWSMNVKFQGKGVCRHSDLMTHNHGSKPSNTPPNGYLDSFTKPDGPCKDDYQATKDDCPGENGENWNTECPENLADNIKKDKFQPRNIMNKKGDVSGITCKPKTDTEAQEYTKAVNESKCLKAKKCTLAPYKNQDSHCCPGQTGHHLLPDAMFRRIDGIKTGTSRDSKEKLEGWSEYTEKKGLVICLEGTSNGEKCGSHGDMHKRTKGALSKYQNKPLMKFAKARDVMAQILSQDPYNCSKSCIHAQINQEYGKMSDDPKKINRETEVVPHSGLSKDTALLKGVKESIPDGIEG